MVDQTKKAIFGKFLLKGAGKKEEMPNQSGPPVQDGKHVSLMRVTLHALSKNTPEVSWLEKQFHLAKTFYSKCKVLTKRSSKRSSDQALKSKFPPVGKSSAIPLLLNLFKTKNKKTSAFHLQPTEIPSASRLCLLTSRPLDASSWRSAFVYLRLQKVRLPPGSHEH